MSRRVNVRAVVWRDGKILAVKHKADDGREMPYWAVPGGGADPMETLQAAMARELMEELGVASPIIKLLFVQQYATKRKGFDEELEFFFQIKDDNLFDVLDLASTTHGTAEISRVEFVDPKQITILPKFLSEIDIEAHINGNAPVYIYDGFGE